MEIVDLLNLEQIGFIFNLISCSIEGDLDGLYEANTNFDFYEMFDKSVRQITPLDISVNKGDILIFGIKGSFKQSDQLSQAIKEIRSSMHFLDETKKLIYICISKEIDDGFYEVIAKDQSLMDTIKIFNNSKTHLVYCALNNDTFFGEKFVFNKTVNSTNCSTTDLILDNFQKLDNKVDKILKFLKAKQRKNVHFSLCETMNDGTDVKDKQDQINDFGKSEELQSKLISFILVYKTIEDSVNKEFQTGKSNEFVKLTEFKEYQQQFQEFKEIVEKNNKEMKELFMMKHSKITGNSPIVCEKAEEFHLISNKEIKKHLDEKTWKAESLINKEDHHDTEVIEEDLVNKCIFF